MNGQSLVRQLRGSTQVWSAYALYDTSMGGCYPEIETARVTPVFAAKTWMRVPRVVILTIITGITPIFLLDHECLHVLGCCSQSSWRSRMWQLDDANVFSLGDPPLA